MEFQTEYDIILPCGYLDSEGNLHREGVMRRATAADEILPLKDPRVVNNQAYLVIILLSRVITRLGGIQQICMPPISLICNNDITKSINCTKPNPSFVTIASRKWKDPSAWGNYRLPPRSAL